MLDRLLKTAKYGCLVCAVVAFTSAAFQIWNK